jgi:uncharacterized membrane protein YeaQ/YmgE (transglycosylase-associated protein family)
MEILIWLMFGALVGLIASIIMGDEVGLPWDVFVGIFGGLLGGSIMSMFGERSSGGINFYSFLFAVLGACFLIYLVREVQRQRTVYLSR